MEDAVARPPSRDRSRSTNGGAAGSSAGANGRGTKPRFAQAAAAFRLPSIGSRAMGPSGADLGPGGEPDLRDTLARGSVLAAAMGSTFGGTGGRRTMRFDATGEDDVLVGGGADGAELGTTTSRVTKALKDRDSLRSALVNIIMQPGAGEHARPTDLPPLRASAGPRRDGTSAASAATGSASANAPGMANGRSVVSQARAAALAAEVAEAAEAAVAAAEAAGMDGPVGTEADKDVLRYYYYINNGIDTEHVTAMDQAWLDHVLALLDDGLKARGPALIGELCDDIREDYLLSVKKSIVDFVLKDPQTDKAGATATWPAFRDQPELGTVPKPWTAGFLQAQATLSRQLFLLHPGVASLLSLWHGDYTSLRMVKVPEFAKKRSALDISVFTKMLSMHIDEARHALQRQWIAQAAQQVHTFLAGSRGPPVPASRRATYLDLCAELMGVQLRGLVLASVKEYVDMLCGPLEDDLAGAGGGAGSGSGSSSGAFKGFILRLTLPDAALAYAPDVPALEAAVLKGITRMVESVSELGRLEYAFPEDERPGGRQRYLQPHLTQDLLEPHTARIRALFASQAGIPGEFLGAYAPYEALVTRAAEDALLQFFEAKRPFHEQTREVMRYRRIASEVQYDLAKVAEIGLFVIHTEAANTELALRANALADRIVARISHEMQVSRVVAVTRNERC